MSEYFVDFEQVWLAYNNELLEKGEFAIEDITLKAKPGEMIAIVGPSGCGKSTFMKLATGLRQPTVCSNLLARASYSARLALKLLRKGSTISSGKSTLSRVVRHGSKVGA